MAEEEKKVPFCFDVQSSRVSRRVFSFRKWFSSLFQKIAAIHCSIFAMVLKSRPDGFEALVIWTSRQRESSATNRILISRSVSVLLTSEGGGRARTTILEMILMGSSLELGMVQGSALRLRSWEHQNNAKLPSQTEPVQVLPSIENGESILSNHVCTGYGTKFSPFRKQHTSGTGWYIWILFPAKVASCFEVSLIGVPNRSSDSFRSRFWKYCENQWQSNFL